MILLCLDAWNTSDIHCFDRFERWFLLQKPPTSGFHRVLCVAKKDRIFRGISSFHIKRCFFPSIFSTSNTLPKTSHDTGKKKSTMNESMYFLLKNMGEFSSHFYVSELRGVNQAIIHPFLPVDWPSPQRWEQLDGSWSRKAGFGGNPNRFWGEGKMGFIFLDGGFLKMVGFPHFTPPFNDHF